MPDEFQKDIARNENEIAKAVRDLFRPSWIVDKQSLWPYIRTAMAAPVPEPPGRREIVPSPFFASARLGWKWAVPAAIAAVASIGLALVGLRSRLETPVATAASALMATGSGPRIEILSFLLEGSPAKAFLFQTKQTSYVWLVPAEKTGRTK